MILEVAILQIKPGQTEEFELSFRQASSFYDPFPTVEHYELVSL
ncbi:MULTISPECIES: hypothetical protein [unclassified Paenibacillus]